MRVLADVTRSGEWWAVQVPEMPGAFTQARRLEQVPGMVRDAVALKDDIDEDSVAFVEVVKGPLQLRPLRTMLDSQTLRDAIDAQRHHLRASAFGPYAVTYPAGRSRSTLSRASACSSCSTSMS